jgi:hypothetical protein
MSKFLKQKELQIINGGYLVDNENNPVNNDAFIKAQMDAKYVVTFAEFAKKKDFEGKMPDSVEDLRIEVTKFLNSTSPVEYISKPKPVEKQLHEKLNKEALDFINYKEKSSHVDRINNFMNQRFNVINDFETFGLFFESGIVKIERIYTIKEITKALNEVIDLID